MESVECNHWAMFPVCVMVQKETLETETVYEN